MIVFSLLKSILYFLSERIKKKTWFNFLTSSIGPKSWISFLSVGKNLTLTFCSWRYLSLKAESCAGKSNSWSMQIMINLWIIKRKTKKLYSQILAYNYLQKERKKKGEIPSNPPGNNKNIRPFCQQKIGNFLVFLQWCEN